MVPILKAEQIKEVDRYTIENKPIASIDLMEDAATACVSWIVDNYNTQNVFHIVCGMGNNGGDGLAIARLLINKKYKVYVYIVKMSETGSKDFETNLKKLKNLSVAPKYFNEDSDIKIECCENSVIIDAIFGSGLTRPVENWMSKVVHSINRIKRPVISIDIPSGLFADTSTIELSKNIICATHTISLELPKLAFMMPENESFTGYLHIVSIGLLKEYIFKLPAENFFITGGTLKNMLKPRKKFSHKGKFGHTLIIAGSTGKMGASILTGYGCLRSGTGLLTMHTPANYINIIHSSLPEAMVSVDEDQECISACPDLSPYNSIGVGPGIGINKKTQKFLKLLIQNYRKPIVFDADALNILTENKTWLAYVSEGSILTPHPGEFDRLFGKTKNNFQRLELQKEYSLKYQIFIVLKGAHTCITTPSGHAYFNSTGNPGMATGGSGDVLTGIITGLLSQGYSSLVSSLLGVYLHGLAGDIACDNLSEESLIASDIIAYLPEAFKKCNYSEANG